MLHILPPARIRKTQVIGRKIKKLAFLNRPTGREFNLILFIHLVAAKNIVFAGSEQNLVAVPACSSNHVHDARKGIPILGIEPSGFDTHLRNRTLGQFGTQTTLNHILYGQTIDQVNRFPDLTTPNMSLDRRTRLEADNLLKLVDRTFEDFLGVDLVRGSRDIGLDERTLGRHLD